MKPAALVARLLSEDDSSYDRIQKRVAAGNEETRRTQALSDDRLKEFLATNKDAQRYAKDIQDVRELEEPWKRVLSQPNRGIIAGGYAYYPTNKSLTQWEASDGSKITNTSVAGMFLDYGGPDVFIDFLSNFPEDADHMIIKKKVDQQGYEGGVLRGDHY